MATQTETVEATTEAPVWKKYLGSARGRLSAAGNLARVESQRAKISKVDLPAVHREVGRHVHHEKLYREELAAEHEAVDNLLQEVDRLGAEGEAQPAAEGVGARARAAADGVKRAAMTKGAEARLPLAYGRLGHAALDRFADDGSLPVPLVEKAKDLHDREKKLAAEAAALHEAGNGSWFSPRNLLIAGAAVAVLIIGYMMLSVGGVLPASPLYAGIDDDFEDMLEDRRSALYAEHGVSDWDAVPQDARIAFNQQIEEDSSSLFEDAGPPPVEIDASARSLITEIKAETPSLTRALFGGTHLDVPLIVTFSQSVPKRGDIADSLKIRTYGSGGETLNEHILFIDADARAGEPVRGNVLLDGDGFEFVGVKVIRIGPTSAASTNASGETTIAERQGADVDDLSHVVVKLNDPDDAISKAERAAADKLTGLWERKKERLEAQVKERESAVNDARTAIENWNDLVAKREQEVADASTSLRSAKARLAEFEPDPSTGRIKAADHADEWNQRLKEIRELQVVWDEASKEIEAATASAEAAKRNVADLTEQREAALERMHEARRSNAAPEELAKAKAAYDKANEAVSGGHTKLNKANDHLKRLTTYRVDNPRGDLRNAIRAADEWLAEVRSKPAIAVREAERALRRAGRSDYGDPDPDQLDRQGKDAMYFYNEAAASLKEHMSEVASPKPIDPSHIADVKISLANNSRSRRSVHRDLGEPAGVINGDAISAHDGMMAKPFIEWWHHKDGGYVAASWVATVNEEGSSRTVLTGIGRLGNRQALARKIKGEAVPWDPDLLVVAFREGAAREAKRREDKLDSMIDMN